MTANELRAFIGQTGLVAFAQNTGCKARVTVLDAKQSYGNNRVLVTPLDGHGAMWIDTASVQLDTAN